MADLGALVKRCRKSTIKMRPVLPLGQPLALGMVGYFDGDAFRNVGSVATMLGTGPGPALRGDSPVNVDIVSGKDVKVSTLAAGETSDAFGSIAQAKARIEITFSSDKSFLLSAQNVAVRELKEPDRLFGAMLRAYKAGLWQENYCFVYQIGQAASFRAALSHQSGAKLLLSAAGTGTAGVAPVASISGKVSFERQSGALEQLVSNSPTPAFFNAYRVKPSFFGKTKVTTASAVAPTATADEITAALGLSASPFQQV